MLFSIRFLNNGLFAFRVVSPTDRFAYRLFAYVLNSVVKQSLYKTVDSTETKIDVELAAGALLSSLPNRGKR